MMGPQGSGVMEWWRRRDDLNESHLFQWNIFSAFDQADL